MENSNGLTNIRQYHKASESFETLSLKEVNKTTKKLNKRPNGQTIEKYTNHRTRFIFFNILGALDMRKCLTPGTGCNFRVFGALDMRKCWCTGYGNPGYPYAIK